MPQREPQRGVSLIELLLVLSIGAIVWATALGAFARARDYARGLGAARAIALRVAGVRLTALRRGATAGLQFRQEHGETLVQALVDGNGNGLRADEIADGTEERLGPPFRLRDDFPGAVFAVAHAVPPIDGEGPALGPGDDPVQIGRSTFIAFGASGSGSSGTLYLAGPDGRQFAVRVFGPTGRVRVLEFLPGTGQWVTP